MHYIQFRQIDGCLRTGMDCATAVRESVPARGSVRELHQGISPIKGVPTKHFLREELLVLLRNLQFDVLTMEKHVYPWSVEFADPPSWLQDPRPWCWSVLACRK